MSFGDTEIERIIEGSHPLLGGRLTERLLARDLAIALKEAREEVSALREAARERDQPTYEALAARERDIRDGYHYLENEVRELASELTNDPDQDWDARWNMKAIRECLGLKVRP